MYLRKGALTRKILPFLALSILNIHTLSFLCNRARTLFLIKSIWWFVSSVFRGLVRRMNEIMLTPILKCWNLLKVIFNTPTTNKSFRDQSVLVYWKWSMICKKTFKIICWKKFIGGAHLDIIEDISWKFGLNSFSF